MTTARELGGYALTGGSAALVDLGGFALLQALGVPLEAAAALSWLLAAVWNYLLAARLVFARPVALAGFGRFVLAQSLGLAINVGLTIGLASAGAPAPAAKSVGIGVAFLVNFLAVRRFVFGRR